MTKSISINFDSGHWLFDPGDFYQVLACVRDYGNKTTTTNTIYSRWLLQIYNEHAFTESNFSIIDNFSVRVW